MKPPPFSYHDPATVEDAVALLAKLPNARPLAGGQSLMPMLNMRFVQPDHIVDLNGVAGMSGITRAAGELRIGAMTRQRELEFSPEVAELCPIMAEALREVGHRQTRNRGTIGGSLCHMDPAAELVTLSLALDAVVEIAGPKGRREIPFAEFPIAYMTPAVEPDELLVGIRYPLWPRGHGSGFVEIARRHGDFAMASAAALLVLDGGGKITRAAVCVGAVSPVPVRLATAEQLLMGRKPDAALLTQAAELARAIETMDDVHAPASYRSQLAAVVVKRALLKACERAGAPIAIARSA